MKRLQNNLAAILFGIAGFIVISRFSNWQTAVGFYLTILAVIMH